MKKKEEEGTQGDEPKIDGIGDLGGHFRCRLFLFVQALTFGVPAGLWVLFSGRFVLGLAVLVGSCLVTLVPITADFGTLGGKSVVMDSLLGLGRRLRRPF